MPVGVALDVAVEPGLVKHPVRRVQKHGGLLLGGRHGLGRLGRAGPVLEGPVSEVEEPLVDGDHGAEVGEGVACEVEDGQPLVLVEDVDDLVSEEGPVVDGTFELDDFEVVHGVEELDELADVVRHADVEGLVCADLRAVALDLVVRDPGLPAHGCDVIEVGVEGALADGHEQRLLGSQAVFVDHVPEELVCPLPPWAFD